MGTLSCYEKVENKIGDVFACFGRFVARHPWKIIVIAVIINLALGAGLLKIEIITDAEKSYLPQGSQARKDEEKLRDIFPDYSRTNFRKLQLTGEFKWAAILVRAKDGNILQGTNLQETEALHDNITRIVATNDDGKQIRLTDICATVNDECHAEGSVFWTPDFLEAIERNDISYPWFYTETEVTNYKTYIGGRIDRNETHLFGMEYIKLEYVFRTDVDMTDDIIAWCGEFLKYLESHRGDSIDTLQAHYDSLDEELDKNVMGDLNLYVVTVVVMIAYSTMTTVSARITNSLAQRVWLGAGGWTATGLSIFSGIGLCSVAGLEFFSIVAVSPFLISGIGVDDMFILLSGLSGAQGEATIEDKLGETMRISGVGITITTLTDLIAFSCGATSSFLSVRNFCIYTGVCVTFCYINNITIFGACLAIHEQRVQARKHWLTCRPIKSKEEAIKEGRKKSYVLCCTGRPTKTREEAESFLDKLPRWILPNIVLFKPMKPVLCLLFLTYLGGAIYGCINMQEGLKFSELPSDTSYYKHYSKAGEDFFTAQSAVSFVITEHLDYSNPDVQNKIDAFMRKVRQHELFEDDFEVNWLSVFKETPFYVESDEEMFVFGLEMFLTDDLGKTFENDVVFDETKTKIISSRIYTRSRHLSGNEEEGDLMLLARDLANEIEFECFAFYPTFLIYEQYVLILYQTLSTIGIALVVVLAVTFVFMPHPLLIVFCTIAVAMTMGGVLGYMYFVDRALSAITMMQVITGVGFSVDFTAHMCHGYMASHGETREMKVRGALEKTGSPITHGALSSLLGIAVLGAAQSYIFRTFALVLSFTLVFGWAHAVFLLPVILSWFGPGHSKPDTPKKSHKQKHKKQRRRQRPDHRANGIEYIPEPDFSYRNLYEYFTVYRPNTYLGNAVEYRYHDKYHDRYHERYHDRYHDRYDRYHDRYDRYHDRCDGYHDRYDIYQDRYNVGYHDRYYDGYNDRSYNTTPTEQTPSTVSSYYEKDNISTNFDKEASVFKVFPNCKGGYYSWTPVIVDDDGEWTKKIQKP